MKIAFAVAAAAWVVLAANVVAAVSTVPAALETVDPRPPRAVEATAGELRASR